MYKLKKWKYALQHFQVSSRMFVKLSAKLTELRWNQLFASCLALLGLFEKNHHSEF